MSEWKLHPKRWHSVVECIQSVINQAPLEILGTRREGDKICLVTPLEVFTGLKPSFLVLFPTQLITYREYPPIEQEKARAQIDIESFREALNSVHKIIMVRNEKSRESARLRKNAKTNIQEVNSTIGIFHDANRRESTAKNMFEGDGTDARD